MNQDVSQGYASNRTTPFTTPNASPSKQTNPTTSTVENISPKPLNIFKTEHEIIQDAIQEVESAKSTAERPRGGDAAAPTEEATNKKRAREEEEYTSEEEEEEEEEEAKEENQVYNATAESPTKRALKGLPRRKGALLKGGSVDHPKTKTGEDDEEPNPFIVPTSAPSN
jgi:hypothetical protein